MLAIEHFNGRMHWSYWLFGIANFAKREKNAYGVCRLVPSTEKFSICLSAMETWVKKLQTTKKKCFWLRKPALFRVS